MAPATGTRRRVTGTASEAVADLGCEQPLDLESTLFSGQVFRWRRVGGWYQGVVCDNIVTLRRTAGGLQFAARPDGAARIAPLLADYLSLDTDLHQVYGSIGSDCRLASAIARYRGMRVLRQDPWECLMCFICTPASNIPRITGNIESICQAFGRPLGDAGATRHGFPTPADLAAGSEPRLRDLGLGYRAAYLAAAARTVAAGDIDLYALREAPYEVALEVLTSLYGVGDKVANCVLLFALDKPKAFPVDTHIAKRLREWYPACARLKPAEMRAWAQDYFGPYAGYANHYLFHDRRLERQRQRSFP
jgi:N-glycosylase/DNA lyase